MLITCRECERKVSSEAVTCPHCGVARPSGGGIKGGRVVCKVCGAWNSVEAATCLGCGAPNPGARRRRFWENTPSEQRRARWGCALLLLLFLGFFGYMVWMLMYGLER